MDAVRARLVRRGDEPRCYRPVLRPQPEEGKKGHNTLYLLLVTLTLAFSWLMTNVTFAYRYAHEFYAAKEDGMHARGLEFPGEPHPDYLDFLYFAFVIGMTLSSVRRADHRPHLAQGRDGARADRLPVQRRRPRPCGQYRGGDHLTEPALPVDRGGRDGAA